MLAGLNWEGDRLINTTSFWLFVIIIEVQRNARLGSHMTCYICMKHITVV